MQALFCTSVLNGFVAVPCLWFMVIANNNKIMGKRVNSRLENILGWSTVLLMMAAVAIFILA